MYQHPDVRDKHAKEWLQLMCHETCPSRLCVNRSAELPMPLKLKTFWLAQWLAAQSLEPDHPRSHGDPEPFCAL